MWRLSWREPQRPSCAKYGAWGWRMGAELAMGPQLHSLFCPWTLGSPQGKEGHSGCLEWVGISSEAAAGGEGTGYRQLWSEWVQAAPARSVTSHNVPDHRPATAQV